jgi:hypothetical protein
MPDALPRSTPAEQGADPAAILRFLDAMEEHPGVEMHSLMGPGGRGHPGGGLRWLA